MSKQIIDINHPEFLEALKGGDSKAFEAVYREVWPQAADYLLQNNGTVEEARDIFQEALIVLVRYLKKPDFNLQVKTNTFIVAIVRRMWLKNLREKRTVPLYENRDLPDTPAPEDPELEHIIYDQRHELLGAMLQEIGAECRILLTEYYFARKPLHDIAAQLGYTDGFVRVKKIRCMNALRKKLNEHPDFTTFQ